MLTFADGDVAHRRLGSGSTTPSGAVDRLPCAATSSGDVNTPDKVGRLLLVAPFSDAIARSARMSKSQHHLARSGVTVH